MSRRTEASWYVFTAAGPFAERGDSAKIALARFKRLHAKEEVVGIIRADLVIEPPAKGSGRPFLCMFIQGDLNIGGGKA